MMFRSDSVKGETSFRHERYLLIKHIVTQILIGKSNRSMTKTKIQEMNHIGKNCKESIISLIK
jgi:hypothetical protein